MMTYAYKKLNPVYHQIKVWAWRYPFVYGTLQKIRRLVKFTYPESPLAHRYLDGLRGIEIGASAFNPFGLNTLNINCTFEDPTIYDYKRYEMTLTGKTANVDLIALGDQLPFPDKAWDFVLSSHVIEHFYDPIKALHEWCRLIRPGGYIFIIAPHRERASCDQHRPRTTLAELIARHAEGKPNIPTEHHHSVWITEDFLELCAYLKLPVVEYQDTDDKAGNGFTVVIRKPT